MKKKNKRKAIRIGTLSDLKEKKELVLERLFAK
jgi:hypothetical protein